MDNKSSSFKQILAEMARRREARRARREAREAIQMGTQHPQQEKWCYTCQRNVTTPVNHLAQWHHVAGMTMLNAHQCENGNATNCGKSGTHMGQVSS